MERLILSVISLFGRQWSKWEVLTISLMALFVLVWMTKQQRSKKVQSKYNKDQFPDSSPLIGLKFGAHNKSRQVAGDWKKERLAPVQKHQNKRQIQTKEPLAKTHDENKRHLQTKEFLEKLQEEIKLLQNETFHHKQANIRFEQQVTELTTHNEILQRELDKSKQAESQNKQRIQTLEKLYEEINQLQNEIAEHKQAKAGFEQQVSELTAENEKLQRELARFEQAEQQIAEMTAACRSLQTEDSRIEQISEQQVATGPAVETPVKRKIAGRGKTSERQHRNVDGVRQKLCRKCKEWKPESEFHKNSSSKDGLAGSCRICKNNAARERRSRRRAAKS